MRHGQSSFNIEHRIQGRLDQSILTELGRHTATLVADAIKGINFDLVYSSPLTRAKSTAEVILSCLENPPKLQVTDLLMEIDLPLWETLVKEEVKQKFPDEYRCWKDQPQEFRMLLPGKDGPKEHFPVLALFAQAQQFWQELLSRHVNGTIMIVAHNGINRALISTALGISPAFYHSIQQSNCGISILNFAGGWGDGVQLESMNITNHLGEIFPKPREGHRGPRLLLVRHGETEWNRQGRFQGQIDVPLNDKGKEQSRQASVFLKDIPIDFAVSSSMLRPKETAELILHPHPQVELKLDDQLREISHGLWEGKFETEIEQDFPGQLQQWKTTPASVQMPEGENLQQVWERAIAAWRSVVASAGNQSPSIGLVVGHDAINKAILCHLFDLSPEHFWNFKQGNGAVTVIDYPRGLDGPPVLEAMNITTHLSGGILDQTAAGAL